MFAKIIVYILFAVSVGTALTYFLSYFKKEKYNRLASYMYLFVTLGFLFISIYLMSNILSNNFKFTYVWSYSSLELPLNLLIASFYSGQEGSFLLWGLLLAIVGYFLLPYVRKIGYESIVMGFYSIILVFILILLIFKSPFEYVWETFADQNLTEGFMPKNGRGLNPILQNYWITIHPPILFLGYASMTVPFVMAISGLIKRDYRKWIELSVSCVLFASGILGLGLMLGGFWAYETLGWGGFWGWDPVENSSLLPWIVSVALVHSMYVHKRTGGLIKTNFVLSVLSFLLVIYATFLTRSGILGDSSVHSFIDPGQTVYLLLVIFQAVFLLIAILALVLRIKDIPRPKINFDLSSKEFTLSLGVIIILASGFIVFVGTSWPIFIKIFGMQKSVIETSFYDQWNLPLAILIFFTNALSLFMNWKKTNISDLLKKSLLSFVISLVLTVIIFIVAATDIQYILLIFAAFFSFFVNLQVMAKYISKSFAAVGGMLSHLGISLLLIGAVASSVYSDKQILQLKETETKEALDHRFTFVKMEQIEKDLKDREKYQFNIKIEKDGHEFWAKPLIYWSTFNDMSSPFFEPGINRHITKDLYLSPMNLNYDLGYKGLTLNKDSDETASPVDDNMMIKHIKFDMSKVTNDTVNQGFLMGTVIQFITPDATLTDTLYANLDLQTMQNDPIWKKLPNSEYEVAFMRFLPNQKEMAKSSANYAFRKIGEKISDPVPEFVFEVSTKPFINLVWLGTIAMVFGFFLSIFKYNGKKLHNIASK